MGTLIAPSYRYDQDCLGMPDSERQKRKLYAVIYVNETGNQKSVWYPNKRRADEAAQRLGRQCRVEQVKV